MKKELNGIIDEIVFRNDDNGYSVINLNSDGSLVTVVGIFPIITEGQNVSLTGEYIVNKKFGEQFKVDQVKVSAPTNIDGIKKYLASGLIKGIGKVTAEAIVDEFGVDTLDIIEYNPLKLAEVRGVSASKAAHIAETFLKIKDMQNAVMYLQSLNLSINMAIKIYNQYGKKTNDIVNANPYKLIEDIDGVGFLSADRIAVGMGVARDSEFRIRAGILFSLKETMVKGGSTYLPCDILYKQTLNLLNLDFDTYIERVKKIIEDLKLDGFLKEPIIDGIKVLTNKKYYNYEKSIAGIIAVMSESKNDFQNDYEKEIIEYERINKIELHTVQKEAVASALNNNFSVITGGPGTGKTTIIKCVIKCINTVGNKISLLAPTGRAAKRLSEATGMNAMTIHRALDLDFTDGERAEMFSYDPEHKLDSDIIIIDEVSMVDSGLMYYLLKVIKRTAKIVIVGDKDQLPSVGCGNVLSDIIKSGVVPVVSLTQIYRQNEKSLIITNAHAINKGEMPELDNSSRDFFYNNKQTPEEILNSIISLVTDRLPKYLGIKPQRIQVLAPIKKGVCGVENLNKKLQENINPQSSTKPEVYCDNVIFRLGDKVMHTVNNYQMEWKKTGEFNQTEMGKGIFNGDIGVIIDVERQCGEITVEFEDGRVSKYNKQDLNQLLLSYAITIHKSQGCEFDAVVIPIMGGAPMISTRNLLYTAVTRAKDLVMLVGKKSNIRYMVNNNFTAERYTMLKFFLVNEKEKVKQLYN